MLLIKISKIFLSSSFSVVLSGNLLYCTHYGMSDGRQFPFLINQHVYYTYRYSRSRLQNSLITRFLHIFLLQFPVSTFQREHSMSLKVVVLVVVLLLVTYSKWSRFYAYTGRWRIYYTSKMSHLCHFLVRYVVN